MHLLSRKPVQVSLVALVCLLLYANTLHAPFYWDDAMLVESPIIKSFHYFLHPSAGRDFSWYGGFLSRFFGYFTFALNYRFGGLDTTGFHLVNVAIHLLASLLVYRLVRLTLRTPFFAEGANPAGIEARAGFIAFTAALLFAAHPIQTQAVTYIVQRFASLAAMLYLLSVTSYLKGRLVWHGAVRRPVAAGLWFGAAAVAAALALKSKETAYTLPLALVLLELLLFTRQNRRRALVLAFSAVPVAALAATRLSSGSLAELTANLDKATRLQTSMGRLDYLATQCKVIVTYLRLLVFPAGQRLDYDYPVYHSLFQPAVFVCALSLAGLLALAVACLRLSRDREDDRTPLLRLVALGIFWFFLALAVESSLIPIVDVIFEHRVYLPSVGAFMAAAAAVSFFGRGEGVLPGWPPLPVVAAVAVFVLCLGWATHARNALWSDEVAFWQDNARKSPQKARVFVNLARAFERRGDPVQATEAYRAAVAIDPNQTDPLLNFGLLLVQAGKLDEALAQFQAALRIDPGLVEAYNNIGKVYGMQRRYDDALKAFQAALELKPTLAEPHNNIGYVYAQQNRHGEALVEYDKCLALYPDYDKAFVNKGTALKALGRQAEAQAAFRRALEINPKNAEAAQLLR